MWSIGTVSKQYFMELISQILGLIKCVKHFGVTPGIVSSHLQFTMDLYRGV